MNRLQTILPAGLCLSLFVAISLLPNSVSAEETINDDAAASVSYQRDIRPIFQANCQGCHQPAKALGDYVMTTTEWLMKPGATGDAPIVAGKPDESYLIEQITPNDGVAEMPKKSKPLAESEVALIRRWIEQGAKDDAPAAGPQYDAEHPPVYTRPPVVTAIDFSPNGKTLAVAGFHEVLIHSFDFAKPTNESRPIARLVGMSERIESVEFSPDGKLIAVTGGKPGMMGEVQIWDAKKYRLVNSVAVTFDTVYGASWSPDSKRLAFGCADNTVRVIEARSGKQVLFQSAHSDWALDTVFSADGTHLATVGRDATTKLIEVSTQRFVDNITSITPGALGGGINAIARHPLRDEVVFGGADGVPKIYRMHRTTKRVIGDDANQLWALPKLEGRVFSVDYSQNGEVIAAGSSLDGKGNIHIYGIAAAPEVPKEITGILTKPTHQRNGDQRKKLQKHFDDGIKTLAKVPVESGGIYAVSIHPESKHVAAAGTDGKIRLIDVATGKVTSEFLAVAVDATNQGVAPASDVTVCSADKPAVTIERETPPANVEITGLRLEPANVALASPTDYAQLLVLATTSAGDTIDVTRMAELSAEGVAHVSPYGLVSVGKDRKNGAGKITAKLGDHSAVTTIATTDADAPLNPDYVQDISPILARAGCNAGTCHGAKDGKNGFKLSLRGYDPIYDVRALTDDLESRRTNLASPASSLFLQKPTGQVPHEGGVILQPESDYYQTLLAWVTQGAPLNLASQKVASIEVQPVNPVVQQADSKVQMRVIATFPSGEKRDVTREAFVESGNTEIAVSATDNAGLIQVLRRGEAPLLVRYEGAYAATTVTVIGNREGFVWNQPPANNKIDEFVHAKLERTKTATSALCDDYTFIRRTYLDLTGLPPTPEQVTAFTDDERDSRWKRSELIDQLIGSPDFVDHWTNKWADLLQVNGKFLGREGATSFRSWIRDHIGKNTPYNEFAHAVITADGSNRENPAASYYKILREPEATMENTTQLFLATRFNCNKCHDHPFERWTQDQYYELSAYFARMGLKKDPESGDKKIGGTAVEGAKPMYEIVYTKPDGEVKHLRTGQDVVPSFPFDCDHEQKTEAVRRQQLATWMTSRDNPYFAKSYANRVWAYLTGHGIIEPIDDIRAGNPPTNPELLDWLTNEFIESGFDTQHLVRIICESRTYQLSLDTNDFNEDDDINYSHARARRLPAEVLYDAIYRTTGAKSTFKGLPADTRAASLPDVGIQLPDGFLNNLGRPARESSCECERSSSLQMGPIMALINGATVGEAIGQPETALASIVKEQADDRQMIEKLFLRILSRPADDAEVDDALELIGTVAQHQEKAAEQLADYQQEVAPALAAREAKKTEQLAAANTELAAHVAKIKPDRDRMAKERNDRIAIVKKSAEEVRTQILAKLPEWESSLSGETVWETLNPSAIASSFGEYSEVLADGSILASGPQKKGENTFIAPANVTGITGLRLEALADDRLPRKGPGRAPNDGNFVLTEIQLFASANPATALKSWDLANGTEGWSAEGDTKTESVDGKLVLTTEGENKSKKIRVATDLPAKPLALDITAKLEASGYLTVLWKGDDDKNQKITKGVLKGREKWQTYRIHFQPKATANQLTLSFEGDQGKQVEIDSIRLVEVAPPKFAQAKLQNATADFSQNGYAVATAIDGNTKKSDRNGWAIAPQMGKSHTAVFETDGKLDVTGNGLVQIKLFQQYQSKNHTLGRYRLSITRSPLPLKAGLPAPIAEILAIKPADRNDEQRKKVEDHYLSVTEEYKQAKAALATAEKPVPPDPTEEQLKQAVAKIEAPFPADPKLVRLQRAADLSKQQTENKRLTAAQDIAWALINSPEFLYNH